MKHVGKTRVGELRCRQSENKSPSHSPLHKLAENNTFVDCSLVAPKDAVLSNFTEKIFMNSHKTSKFMNFFPPLLYSNKIQEGHAKW